MEKLWNTISVMEKSWNFIEKSWNLNDYKLYGFIHLYILKNKNWKSLNMQQLQYKIINLM